MSRPDTAQLMFNTANLHYHSPYHPPKRHINVYQYCLHKN